MNTRNVEYDRFGPWVIEISDEDPVPPLFAPHLTRTEMPLICVKVPRKVERRHANPGMHLYDFLVTLYEDDLVILKRVGEKVRSESCCYRDIQYVRFGEALLKGNVRLAMQDRVYDLPFNTVSSEIMRRVVALIRQRYLDPVAPIALGNSVSVREGELSFYFTRLLADELAVDPNLRLLAFQQEMPVVSHEASRQRRIFFGLLGRRLLESLHLCDGYELTVIDRGQTYGRRREAIYATETYYLPLSKIVDVSWVPDPGNHAVSWLTVRTLSSQVASFVLATDNPSCVTYQQFLTCTNQPMLAEPVDHW